MGQNLLTPEQKEILEFASKDEYLTKTFYLTGGTALSYFYFKHRLSEDLDFFTRFTFDSKKLLSVISKIGDFIRPTKIEQQSLNQEDIFYFYFGESKFVKLDFAVFPFGTLGNFTKLNHLKVTSIEDIGVNKVHAISTRRRSRDYFDLFLIMKKLKWTSVDLRKNYRLKFDINLPVEQLVTSFINVLDAQDLPNFLGNYDFEKVKKFFLKEAKKLKKNIIK